MKKKIVKIGSSSYGVIFPKSLLDVLGFELGRYLNVTSKEGKIIIEPVKEEKEF